MFVSVGLQLSLDAADRLAAQLVRAQQPIDLRAAATLLIRAPRVPGALARRLVGEIVDSDARFSWFSADSVGLASWAQRDVTLADAVYCVVDLETTGTRAASDRIVEIGAVRVEALAVADRFHRLVDPGIGIPEVITRITGIRTTDVAGCAPIGGALEAFTRFAGDAVLVAHNARFDTAFLDAALARAHGRKLACRVLDTVGLARRLVPGRRSYALGVLADRYDTTIRPSHRALPDALATAELLLMLIGRAQERGAVTVDDLIGLSRPAARAAHARRRVVQDAPRSAGTYVMRDAHGRALYVGTANDLRRRTSAYFRGGAQPRAVEQVLGVVDRVEYHRTGSGFEARLDEIRMIGELRPHANRRGARPDRLTYLRLDPDPPARLVAASTVRLNLAVYAGPVGSRRDAERVVQALRSVFHLRSCRGPAPSEEGCVEGRLGRCLAPCRGEQAASAHDAQGSALTQLLLAGGQVPVAALTARRRELAASLRFEEAARLRDAAVTLRDAAVTLRRVREARALHGVVLCRHHHAAVVRCFAVAYGVEVERRVLPRSGGGLLEAAAICAAVTRGVETGAGGYGPAAVDADRRDEAMLFREAFTHPPIGVVAVAYCVDTAAFRDAVTAARSRVPTASG